MLWLIPVSVVSPVGCMRMCGVEIVGVMIVGVVL
jgi:hypothetical protein